MQFHADLSGIIMRPDMIFSSNGVAIVKFDMPYDVYNSQTKKNDSQWVRCAGIGERFQKIYEGGYLTEKRTVCVRGTIKTTAFMKNNGTPGSSIEMKLDSIEFVQISRGNENANPQMAGKPQEEPGNHESW